VRVSTGKVAVTLCIILEESPVGRNTPVRGAFFQTGTRDQKIVPEIKIESTER
jgi:hypothetical protein